MLVPSTQGQNRVACESIIGDPDCYFDWHFIEKPESRKTIIGMIVVESWFVSVDLGYLGALRESRWVSHRVANR